MRNLGVRVERADVRWVGARRKKSTQVFWGVCWVWVAPFELILLFTSVNWLFCLGPRETITTSIVETLYSYPEKLVQWRHSTASSSS